MYIHVKSSQKRYIFVLIISYCLIEERNEEHAISNKVYNIVSIYVYTIVYNIYVHYQSSKKIAI